MGASPSCTYHGSCTHNLHIHGVFPDALYCSGQKLLHMTVAPLFQNNKHNKSLTRLPLLSIFNTKNTALPFFFALCLFSSKSSAEVKGCMSDSQNGRIRETGEMWWFGGSQGAGNSSLGQGQGQCLSCGHRRGRSRSFGTAGGCPCW